MKNMIRFLIVSLFLTGCMDTAIRLWNGGPYISPQDRKLFDECSDEVDKIMGEEPSGNPDSPEVQKWLLENLKRIAECEKRRKAK